MYWFYIGIYIGREVNIQTTYEQNVNSENTIL